jgi:hypothetical protein
MLRLYILSLSLILLVSSFCHGQSNQGESTPGYITSLPPIVPIAVSPSDSSVNMTDTILLTWMSQIHTSAFSLQVSYKSDFSILTIEEANLADTSYSISGLASDMSYYWRINASNRAGESGYSSAWNFTLVAATGVDWKISSNPEEYDLNSPYPNPSHSEIAIIYYLPQDAKVSVTIYNSLGQAVKELVSENKKPGRYKVTWNGNNYHNTPVPDGLYICVLSTGNRKFSKSFLVKR